MKVRKKLHALKTGWYLWLFPLFAVMITAWLLMDYFQQTGEVIKILFDDAAGIQAEKTRVRFRGVPIGTVKDVYLSEDNKDVVAEVLLRRDAEHFAVEGSRFSLVTPKVNFQGISGLETIFEGTYITVVPGKGNKQKVFNAAASATAIQDDTSAYILETANVESIQPGDSVSYRGLKIGTVSKMILAKDGQTVNVQINVEHRYARVIRTNTVFWRKPAVQAKLGLFASEIRVNSLETIMNSGIELSTPNEAGPMAKALHKFGLGSSPPKEYEKWNPKLDN